MNSLLHTYAVYFGKIRKVPPIDYVKHQQISGYQKKIWETAKKSFFRGAKLWNSLSFNYKLAASLSTFKHHI